MISSAEQNYFRIFEDRKTHEHLRGCASTASNCFALVNCESRFSLPFRTATQQPSSLVQMFANRVLLPLLLLLSLSKFLIYITFFARFSMLLTFRVRKFNVIFLTSTSYVEHVACKKRCTYYIYYEKISSVISYFVSICNNVNRCKSS